MINESTCILVASAFTNGALEGAADLEEGTVMLSKSPFIAPASFAVCAPDAAKVAESKDGTYSFC